MNETICPGCGLRMPRDEQRGYDGYYHTSAECWHVYTELLGREFGNVVIFGQVHQITVDSYAVQHAGGPHPDKSIDVHLVGLLLVKERGLAPPQVPAHLQALARSVGDDWPHFAPPASRGERTVFDAAMTSEPGEYVEAIQAWSDEVWRTWAPHHAAVAAFANRHLD